MAVTPASAVELPVGSSQVTIPGVTQAAPAEDSADRHRHRRYRRDRVDAGDVIAGVLILGGIAAIASAASRDKRQRDADYRYRNRDNDYRDRDYRYRDRRQDSRYDGGSGIDNAVNMCVREVERNVRIDTVDEVNRSGEGWRVAGRLYNGQGFSCRIGNNGRIEDIDYGRGSVSYSDDNSDVEDNQWDDERYRSARAETGYTGPDTRSQRQPSYPGGPIDGDIENGEDEDLTNGRYD